MTTPWQPGGFPPRLNLYLTPPHPCGYLPGREAATLFVDPGQPMNPALYDHLLERGFRRSGEHVYRPYCGACRSCVPVRIPVARFQPGRTLRRIWKRNRDLVHENRTSGFRREYFELYRRYLAIRHSGGTHGQPEPADFMNFLGAHWAHTRFHEFRLDGRLALVAVTDVQPHSLSAVYTFFDPDLAARSPGTFAILWQTAQALREGRSWLYLGYWVADCPKMSYKARFNSLEAYDEGGWITLPKQENG